MTGRQPTCTMPNLPAPSDPDRVVADPDRAPALFRGRSSTTTPSPRAPHPHRPRAQPPAVTDGRSVRQILLPACFLRRTLTIYRDSPPIHHEIRIRGRHHGTPLARGRLARDRHQRRAASASSWSQTSTASPGRRGPGGPPPWLRTSSASPRAAPATGQARAEGATRRRTHGDHRRAAPRPAADEPINGYQVIQEIAELSNGEWRPSPGSVYPTIQQLQDEGLVETDDERGRRTIRLTDAGVDVGRGQHRRARLGLGALRPHRSAHRPADRPGRRHQERDRPGHQRRLAARHPGLRAAARAALDVLVETRRRLYGILADGTGRCAMSQPDPRLRIADSDRERAMADLAMHYADGRLDHEEYDERLDAIWTARTRADLGCSSTTCHRPQPSRRRAPAAARTRRAEGCRCCRSSPCSSSSASSPGYPSGCWSSRCSGSGCGARSGVSAPVALPRAAPGRADYRRRSHGW